MNRRKKRKLFLSLFIVLPISFLLVLISSLIFPLHMDGDEDKNLGVQMRFSQSDTRLTAMELAERDFFTESTDPAGTERKSEKSSDETGREGSRRLLPGESVRLRSNYAYLWLQLSNDAAVRKKVYISNLSRNSYTELLVPSSLGAYTLAAHGDTVPLSETPVFFRKASFPVNIEKKSTRNFILEFHDPRRIVVAPRFFSPSEFYKYSSREQRNTAFTYGFVLALLSTVIFTGILLRNRLLFALFLLLTAAFLFFLLRSGGVQYLLPGFTFNDWYILISLVLTLIPAVFLFAREIRSGAGAQTVRDNALYGKGVRASDFSSLRLSIVQQISHQFRFPMETVLAASERLEYDYSDSSVVASGKLIREEITELKRILDVHTITTPMEIPETQRGRELFPYDENPSESYGRVRLFSADEEFAAHVAFILRSSHFEVSITGDYYQMLGAVTGKDFDVLLIHPSSVGEKAFELCSLIRAEHNMLDVPILMTAFPNRDSLIKAGYAAGVNDFVTAPFDGSELITRVASLVKLREIARNNKDLVQSEKEKNVFLYFLTHNVNTPLTLLINRIRELEEFLPQEDLDEIVEDLRESSREISDIVRNVLISFRIADGRQTLFAEEFDPASLLYSIEREIQKKCRSKGQEFSLEIPPHYPNVHIDSASVKGSLYNIIDNAVKFTPTGGRIEVELKVHNYGAVDIEVRDTGPGIPEEDEARLFSRFEPLTPRPSEGESSTGLGLYVAYELIKMNGGKLKYSPYSEGACFTVTLPVYEQKEG